MKRADSMAIEVMRLVDVVMRDVVDAHAPKKANRQRNGDDIPLFAWLRAMRRAPGESGICRLVDDPKSGYRLPLMSRSEAAAQVTARIARQRPMTATQLYLLHKHLTWRYGGKTHNCAVGDWLAESPFRELYRCRAPLHKSPQLLELALLEKHPRLESAPSAAFAALTNQRLTDALLTAHLYAALKPNLLSQIEDKKWKQRH